MMIRYCSVYGTHTLDKTCPYHGYVKPRATIARRTFKPLTDGNVYILRISDTGERDPDGKMIARYSFKVRTHAPANRGYLYEILFAGANFHAPAHWRPSEIANDLMGFLTMRPGDTDPDYFSDYTDRQLEFAQSFACEIIGGFVH